jgi:uncharacterized membrane protein
MFPRVVWTLTLSLGLAIVTSLGAQEVVSEEQAVWPLDEEGRLVQFERDIAPILQVKCIECHGPDDAKNDFRVDDRDLVMDYIEPEDFESSTMYVDYLTIDDEDMLMPPKTHGGPLSAGELALIRVWIEEGAHWPDDFAFSIDGKVAQPPAPPAAAPKALVDRLWMAQGFLHPATIHFPIALLTVGALFVVLGWKWPSIGTQVPLACLMLGAASAAVSTLMGWAFAPEQGYGSGWNVMDWGREIDVHRWSGVIVTIVSCLLAVIALLAVWTASPRLTKIWKVGLLVCAAMVGAVGHQGGELSYGTDFYPRALRILTGQTEKATPVDAVTVEETALIEVTSPAKR